MNLDRKKMFTWLFCLSFAGLLQAQKEVYLNPNAISQVRFSMTPAFYSPLEIESEGVSILQSDVNFSGELTITFTQMIWNGFGIDGGMGYTMIPYNFTYDFEAAPGSPIDEGTPAGFSNNYSSAPRTDFEDAYNFPLTLVKIFPLKGKDHLYLNFAAGIKYNIPVNYPVHTTGGSSVGVGIGESIHFLTYEHGSGDIKNYISYNFKAGVINFNKRSNSFHCNLVCQYTPSTLLTGTFEFHDIGYPSKGTLAMRNNFIGLELSYGLTLGK